MLKLVVRLHGQQIQSLDLEDPGREYWAGRGEGCQIPLKAESGISRQHFRIFHKEGTWQLEVVSRFNQVKMGNDSISGMVLSEGLAFSLSPYEFSVQPVAAANAEAGSFPLASGDEGSATLQLDSEGEPSGDRTMTRAMDRAAQVLFLYRGPESRDEQIYMLTKDTYLVGREAGCDILLDDARVSRKQFKLVRKRNRYYLIDNQGVNGTYVNKNKILSKDPLQLNSGDKITVLNHRFTFEIRDPEYENKVQKVQHLALVDPVLPPEFQEAADPEGMGLGLPMASSGDPYGGALNYPGFGPGPMGDQAANPQFQYQMPPPAAAAEGVRTLNFGKWRIPLTKKNKIRLFLGGVIFIGFIILATEEDAEVDVSKQVAAVPADPFSKLTIEEQKQVEVQYQLAYDQYSKGNYQLAKDELAKVLAKVPSYKDSENLGHMIDLGIDTTMKLQQEMRLKQEEAEREERIKNIVAFCKQQIKPETTSVQVEECLAPAIQLNPEHPDILQIRQDVAAVEEERRTREAADALRAAQVAELKKQYTLAQEVGEKDPLKGIDAFNDFLKLTMPDPDKLQDKAKDQIKKLKAKIKSRVNAAIASVRGLVDAGKHKDAVMALEKAMVVAPDDQTLKDEIDRITEELRKKMQILYQEAILEENLGNIETSKERWRKILENDIPNGEYFAKAKSKIMKYGGP